MSLPDLAAEVGMDPSFLSKGIRRAHGQELSVDVLVLVASSLDLPPTTSLSTARHSPSSRSRRTRPLRDATYDRWAAKQNVTGVRLHFPETG